MKNNIFVTHTFEREFKRLAKKYLTLVEDLLILKQQLISGEEVGTDLGSGFRKIRLQINSKNKGKSAGARVITLSIVVSSNEMNTSLLYIYDKSERSSISKKELKKLREKNNL